ncbi:MAG: ankyrin repeat domain-containing protein [Phycisphaerales bacterium]|nr:ankyrin repeat domain-containing protein [Phycisphaerales bacterium]
MNADREPAADDLLPERHPLIDAAMFFDANAVDALLAAGADPHVTDERGVTALHAAAWMGDGNGDEECELTRRIIESLLRAGADPNARQAHGYTPLHYAVEGDAPNVTAVHALLRSGANPNAQDADGSTPLHGAVEQAARACVDALLAAGADWSICNSDGESPADLARVSVTTWEETVRRGPMDLSDYGISTVDNPLLSDEAIRGAFARCLDDARAILERAASDSELGRRP